VRAYPTRVSRELVPHVCRASSRSGVSRLFKRSEVVSYREEIVSLKLRFVKDETLKVSLLDRRSDIQTEIAEAEGLRCLRERIKWQKTEVF
jgi:hypothetical protein